jgi:hypothetical protein
MPISDSIMDLDELHLMCRNEKARLLISDAIKCYKIGAYRQAIVATWIAIVYDYIAKLQELDIAGDKQAKQDHADYEMIRASHDIKKSLEFERNIIDYSKTKYELLTSLEYIDINRIFEDRNRCAHPAMNSTESPYYPTAELTRTHIRNAVEIILQHPPVQGKAALDKLIEKIDSAYFPTYFKDAEAVLAAGPLARPRESLVRNFVIVIIKELLRTDLVLDKHRRYIIALNVTGKLHQLFVEKTIKDNLNSIVAGISDDELHRVIIFLDMVKDCWQFLQIDQQTRLKTYTKNIPDKHIHIIEHALSISDLNSEAMIMVSKLSDSNIVKIIDEYSVLSISQPIINRAVVLYCDANSFADANYSAKNFIIPFRDKLNQTQLESIIKASRNNSQIRGSKVQITVLTQLRSALIIPEVEFNLILEANGFTEDIKEKY